jgi:hypothetical protein
MRRRYAAAVLTAVVAALFIVPTASAHQVQAPTAHLSAGPRSETGARSSPHTPALAPASAARSATDYRIFKRYYTELLAATDRGQAASKRTTKPIALVLRYGIGRSNGTGWGLNHLKQRHHWSKALDSALEFMALDPNASVKERGKTNTYSWFDEYEHDGELCIIEAGEDRNELADHEEKGITSATLECGTYIF